MEFEREYFELTSVGIFREKSLKIKKTNASQLTKQMARKIPSFLYFILKSEYFAPNES